MTEKHRDSSEPVSLEALAAVAFAVAILAALMNLWKWLKAVVFRRQA